MSKNKALVDARIEESLGDFDGPYILPEEELFYAMILDGIAPDETDKCDYFLESDYSSGVVARYKNYVEKHPEYVVYAKTGVLPSKASEPLAD